REVPYRATGLSWRAEVPGIAAVLTRAFLDDIEGVPVEDIDTWRMGFLLDEQTEAELGAEITAVIERFRKRDPGEGARPVSLFVALHPERRPATDG
ncbi:MAG: ArsR family transcriptional regulator, partial [Pseudolysinimonas sp.]